MNMPLAPKFLEVTLTSGAPVLLNMCAIAYAVADGSGSKIYLLTGTNDALSVQEAFASLTVAAGAYLLTRPSPVPYG
jgi:hypothetical protein